MAGLSCVILLSSNKKKKRNRNRSINVGLRFQWKILDRGVQKLPACNHKQGACNGLANGNFAKSNMSNNILWNMSQMKVN